MKETYSKSTKKRGHVSKLIQYNFGKGNGDIMPVVRCSDSINYMLRNKSRFSKVPMTKKVLKWDNRGLLMP